MAKSDASEELIDHQLVDVVRATQNQVSFFILELRVKLQLVRQILQAVFLFKSVTQTQLFILLGQRYLRTLHFLHFYLFPLLL